MSAPFDAILSATAALLVVLGLIVLAARAAKSAGFARSGNFGRLSPSRLSVQDGLSLDRTRRMSIIRCDGRDLLLLTGGPSDLVIGWLPVGGPVQPDAPK